MAFVFAGVVRPVGLDAVDRDERAVRHHVQLGGLGLVQCLVELRGSRGQEFHGLLDGAPLGRGGHHEPGGHFREGLAFAHVDQDEQGVLAGVEQAPGRPDALAVPTDHPGEVVQG